MLQAVPPPLYWPEKSPQRREAVPSDGYLLAGFSAEIWHRMAALAARQSATLYVTWLAAFAAFLCAQTPVHDVVIGTYISNRKRPELQNMFGYFSNLVALRFNCDHSQTFRSWLVTVRQLFASAVGHSDVPHAELLRMFARDGLSFPEITTLFNSDKSEQPVHAAGVTFSREEFARTVAMPWGFSLSPAARISDCRVMFDASIYDPHVVRAAISEFTRFVDAVSTKADLPMACLLEKPSVDNGAGERSCSVAEVTPHL